MTFEEAFKEIRNGKKITCKNWTLILGKPQYLYVKNDEIYFHDGIDELSDKSRDFENDIRNIESSLPSD